jgi:hypothetical protein
MLGMTTLRRARTPPPGAQLQRGVDPDDPFFASPGEHAPEHGGDSTLGAARCGSAVPQHEVANDGVEFGQVQVTDPGIAENGQQVDVQAGPFLRERRLGPRSTVALVPVGDQVACSGIGEPDVLALHLAGPPLGELTDLLYVGQLLIVAWCVSQELR